MHFNIFCESRAHLLPYLVLLQFTSSSPMLVIAAYIVSFLVAVTNLLSIPHQIAPYISRNVLTDSTVA